MISIFRTCSVGNTHFEPGCSKLFGIRKAEHGHAAQFQLSLNTPVAGTGIAATSSLFPHLREVPLMVLYLIRVEATYGADVSIGDQVIEGQRLGTAADRCRPVLSPTRGIVRAVVCDAATHTLVIHVLNKDEDVGFTAGRGNSETFCARVGGFGL
jgi:hypothetical protein